MGNRKETTGVGERQCQRELERMKIKSGIMVRRMQEILNLLTEDKADDKEENSRNFYYYILNKRSQQGGQGASPPPLCSIRLRCDVKKRVVVVKPPIFGGEKFLAKNPPI